MSGALARARGRADRLKRAASRELEATRALRREQGIKLALAARVRWNLGLDGVSDELHALATRTDGLEAHISHVVPSGAAVGDSEARWQGIETRVRRLELLQEGAAMTAWVRSLPASDLPISVLMATRDRLELLGEAIASVRAQRHDRWELVIVDDGSTDGTGAWLDTLDDPRITVLHHDAPGRGQGTALNLALAHASGDVIAYLDDDNRMTPEWLRALAWGFEEYPDADVVTGALVSAPQGGPAVVHLVDWDDQLLDLVNLVDHNAIAHRAGLAEVRFDEGLVAARDWDLLRRLTREEPPLQIGVIAAAYRTSGNDRASASDASRTAEAEVQRRNLRGRPLRILGHNAIFPLPSETYIHDELHALERLGAQVAWCQEFSAPAHMAVSQPVYRDFETAVAEVRPDVVLMHWADFALSQVPRLEAASLPFGVRIHSFDAVPEIAEQLRAHPQCIGVWSYPSEGHQELGTWTLPPIFSSADQLPLDGRERDTVLSISAGLPKKDWPLLFEAMAGLPGVRRRIVAGVTVGHENIHAELGARAAAISDPPGVRLNATRKEALDLYARTAVLVYTLTPESRFGMPMSIAEALTAGCAVVVPDRPECRRYAGPNARVYRSADDIVRHVNEVLAGGPAIDAEREANREYGLRTFCAPELGERFHAELLDGLDRWRARRIGLPEPPPLTFT